MLAVVHLKALALERIGRPAEPAPDLQQRHLRARLHAVKRRRYSGEPTADHRDTLPSAHATQPPPPSMLLAATHIFSAAGSDMRSARARSGWA